MERCPRCSTFVEAGWAYCPPCGRPRILESLQAPVVPPAWQRQVWRGVLAVASLWLVVTVAVAFLREAKAVRVSRQLLAEGKPQEAWSKLSPFLNANPDHAQAVFLCGKATVRLGLKDEAKGCLEKNRALSPELEGPLQEDYRQALTARTRALDCDALAFSDLFDWARQLGNGFGGSVIAGLEGLVETCIRARNTTGETAQIAAMLSEQGLAVEMVKQGYVPAIQRAVAQQEYLDAELLAGQGYQMGEGAELVDAALAPERQKVEATVATLVRLRDTLQADTRSCPDEYWRFPAETPAVVQSARDGWGNAVLYKPHGPQEVENRCHPGFELISYGGDGVETENARQGSPVAEIVYRRVPGEWQFWEVWELPNELWRKRD